MLLRSFALLTSAVILTAQEPHPTGPRMTPPTLASVSPRGVARGNSVEMTLEGFNLAGAKSILFSKSGVTGKILRVKELPDLPDIRLGSNGTPSTIDVGPLPPRNQVTVELDVDPEAEIGPVSFRVLTPLGTSPEGRFLIEPFYGESVDREPNDTLETAVETFLPAILAGAISKPGDVDYFKIRAEAGQSLVFENGATELGSSLQPLIGIYSEDGRLLKEVGRDTPRTAEAFDYRFETAGTYYVRITDFEQGGRSTAFYRLKAGKFGWVTSAWPAGVPEGKGGEVALHGYNVPAKAMVEGKASPENVSAVLLRPKGAFNRVKLSLSPDPERAAVSNTLVDWPVTLNGRLPKPGEAQTFRFRARKGHPVVFEVEARRLLSELDSELDVFDASGKPVAIATARAVWETITVLNERDSASRGIRIQNWDSLAVGDYVLVGGEIIRVEALPKGPDDDMIFESFEGQRISYFGTTTEAHSVDKAVYKVQIHPPGTRFTANGLPQVQLTARNDDGGPGYGKDSYLVFDPPADGEYSIRLRDVRGFGGEHYFYRLSIRQPRPDFRLSIAPRNPNVPEGGAIPLTVIAQRLDGFDGPIDVTLEGLPAGLKATKSVIAPGQVATTLLLSCAAGTKLNQPAPLNAVGHAQAGTRALARYASPEDLTKVIAVGPPADIQINAETREVTLQPGSTAEVLVTLERRNGFGGRVPVEVRNLPPRVRVLDVGLNGVLLNETETKRSFTLEALVSAEPIEQWIYVSGLVETRSPQQNSYASEIPVLLKVKPGSVSQTAPAATRPSGAR